jgi:hypothetical protein
LKKFLSYFTNSLKKPFFTLKERQEKKRRNVIHRKYEKDTVLEKDVIQILFRKFRSNPLTANAPRTFALIFLYLWRRKEKAKREKEIREKQNINKNKKGFTFLYE